MNGGTFQDTSGTVFRLTPSPTGATEQILHDFGGPLDGYSPFGGLTADSSGHLYGVTGYGGNGNGGVLFEVIP
ncbi:MAG: hypothetical protein H0X25_11440 [Acidobacteriales bacterium]|nr:hypothetical protein [Terriglobales bacterium]